MQMLLMLRKPGAAIHSNGVSGKRAGRQCGNSVKRYTRRVGSTVVASVRTKPTGDLVSHGREVGGQRERETCPRYASPAEGAAIRGVEPTQASTRGWNLESTTDTWSDAARGRREERRRRWRRRRKPSHLPKQVKGHGFWYRQRVVLHLASERLSLTVMDLASLDSH